MSTHIAFQHGGVQSLVGDARHALRTLESRSVQTCVTSPPYYGLRDYGGVVSIWGGDEDCAHQWEEKRSPFANSRPGPNGCNKNTASRSVTKSAGSVCRDCGAWCGGLGTEPTPELFIRHLVEVFREVHRVLRDDGTLWLNLGDSYAGCGNGLVPNGTKKKDLIGIPWMAAFALRADGWYLRTDIIWHKPSPMPESVRDRPTRAHEYLFLLSKSPRYYYDAESIAEPCQSGHRNSSFTNGKTAAAKSALKPVGQTERAQQKRARALFEQFGLTTKHLDAIRAVGLSDAGKALSTQSGAGKNTAQVQRLAEEAKAALGGYYREFLLSDRRNKRSVWTVPTVPYGGGHFAVFPPELIRPCILAGAPQGGVVLDPFAGSGTTALVARQEDRRAILCEANPDYIALQKERLGVHQPVLFDESIHTKAEEVVLC